MTINFLIRSNNKKKPVTIYLRLRDAEISWYLATPYSIMGNHWCAKRGKPIVGKTNHEELLNLTSKLNEIEKAVCIYVNDTNQHDTIYTREDIKQIINNISHHTQSSTTSKRQPIIEYLDFLIEAMMKKTFKHHSANYDEHSIKMWKNFRDVFQKFVKEYETLHNTVITWDSIDKTIYDAFITFCENRNYMTKSINKFVVCFKATINYSSYYHRLHQNTSCLRYFSKLRIIKGACRAKVYLTNKELEALYYMEIEKGSLKDKVRDIFLVGCFTGQRVSDYSRLTAKNFTTTPKGTKVVCLIQKKTNNYVLIPFLTEKLIEILEKYDYNLPHISDVIINRYIKQICKELSSTHPSLAEPITSPLTMREVKAEKAGTMSFDRDMYGNVVKPKYQLISSHTARRSTITNLYNSKLFSTYQLMSISGHRSEATFWTYLSQSTEEIADEIARVRDIYRGDCCQSNNDLF